jgi:nicotinamidase-related amidase
VINPLLERLRPQVKFVMYSMRSGEKPEHKKAYRSIRNHPSAAEQAAGLRELHATLKAFKYEGNPLPAELKLSETNAVRDYFEQFPGLDATAKYNNEGFWDLPTPVCSDVKMHPEDIVIYDDDGYPALREFLKKNEIRHVILTGYATDMCFCLTTAGYKNLSKDFNVSSSAMRHSRRSRRTTATLCHQCPHLLRGPQSTDHAMFADQTDHKQQAKGTEPRERIVELIFPRLKATEESKEQS